MRPLRPRAASASYTAINTTPSRPRAASASSIAINTTNHEQNVIGNPEDFEDFVIEKLHNCNTIDEVTKVGETIKHAVKLIQSGKPKTSSLYFPANDETNIDDNLLNRILTEQHHNIMSMPETKEGLTDDEEDKNDFDNRSLSADLRWLKELIDEKTTIIILNDWVNESNIPAQQEAREEAQSIIIDCINNKSSELDLENIGLDALPPFDRIYKQLAHVTMISLSGNQLTELPDNAFAGLPNLKELNLSRNRLTTLSEAFEELTNLQILLLDGNKLKSLGIEFVNLKNLLLLALSQNRIVTINPQAFSAFGNIEINLSKNKISRIEDHTFNCIKGIRNNIYLEGNKIEFIDKNAFNEIHINFLDLSSNKISDIHLNGLNVHELDLSKNRITIIKTDAFGKSFIGKLDLSGNKLQKINEMAFGNIIGISGIATNPWILNKPDIFQPDTAFNPYQNNGNSSLHSGRIEIRYDTWMTSYLTAGDIIDPDLEKLMLGLLIVSDKIFKIDLTSFDVFNMKPIVKNEKILDKILFRIFSNKIENGISYLKFIPDDLIHERLIFKPQYFNTQSGSKRILFDTISKYCSFENVHEDSFNEAMNELSNDGFNNSLRTKIDERLQEINVPEQIGSNIIISPEQLGRIIKLNNAGSFKQFATNIRLIIGEANPQNADIESKIKLEKFIRYLYTQLENEKKIIALAYCIRMGIPEENQDNACNEIINFDWKDAANQIEQEERHSVGNKIIQLKSFLPQTNYEEFLLKHIFYMDAEQIKGILNDNDGYETKNDDENISDSTRQQLKLTQDYYNYLGEENSPLLLAKDSNTNERCIIALPNIFILNERLKVDFELQDIQILTQTINNAFNANGMTTRGLKNLELPLYFKQIISTKFTVASILGTIVTKFLIDPSELLKNGKIKLDQGQKEFTESAVQQVITNPNTTIIGNLVVKKELIKTKEDGAPTLTTEAQSIGGFEEIFTNRNIPISSLNPDSKMRRQNILPEIILERYVNIFDIDKITSLIDDTHKKLRELDNTITKEEVFYIFAAIFWKFSSINVFGYEEEGGRLINQSSIFEREFANICASLLLTSDSIDNQYSEAEKQKIRRELYETVINGGCTQTTADQFLPQRGNYPHPLAEKRRRMEQILSRRINFL